MSYLVWPTLATLLGLLLWLCARGPKLHSPSLERRVWARLAMMYNSGYFEDYIPPDVYLMVDVAGADLDPEQIAPYVREWLYMKGLPQ